jgi:protein O-mannosyl-transferase
MPDSRTYNLRLILLLSLLLVSVTIGIFWQTGNHDFISLDDGQYVTENSHIRAGLTRESLGWAFKTIEAANWHPLTWLSHMADSQIYGMNPGRHHLTSVLLHAANTLLLFLFLSATTKTLWRSFFVAALFAIHPLHVESVAWVAERKDVLSTFFSMLTLLLYVRYVARPGFVRYCLALSAFAMGLMAKPMLVTLPFVLLLLDYWPLRRFTTRQATAPPMTDALISPHQKFSILKLAREKIPFFILSVASSVITLFAQKAGGALAKLEAVSLPYRVANALLAYAGYLEKMCWPKNLAIIYPLPPTIPALKIVGAALLLTVVSFLVVRKRHRHPYLLVGWLWYLGTLVPVIGLVQVGSQAMADRYTYFPLIGPFFMLVWGISEQLSGWRYRNAVLAAAGAIVLTLLGYSTWQQLGYWKNNFTIYGHALKVTENNKFAYINLGVALSETGGSDVAIPYYTSGLRNRFYAADAHLNLGILLAGQGKYFEAIRHYQQALQLRPDDAEAWYNLGLSLASQGKTDEAIAHFREALRLNPDDADTHNNLGVLLAGKKKFEEAISHYSEALRIRPDFEQARNNLGIAIERYRK